jgi:pyrroloquinoline quinone biosynthesis protein B
MAGARGRIESINRSDGGVPKSPVAEARIDERCVDGDRQRDLRFHGGPSLRPGDRSRRGASGLSGRGRREHAVVTAARVAVVLVAVAAAASAALPPPVRAVVLGIAQDGGLPHIGCRREPCEAARRDPARRQRVASLGLVDDRAGRRFLIDATPDLPSQLDSLNAGRDLPDRLRPVDGILLTHAHVGHYAGLLYLGREALGAKGVPVFATPRMARFLRENAPWSQLVSLGNIELTEIEPGRERVLTPDLKVTALPVPHRDEFSDTVAYRIRGPSRSVLYVPDIDRWERWDRRLEDEVAAVDLALVDGSFHDADEVPGRSLAEIPHPLVGDTVSRVPARLRPRLVFIHLNHTNRLLWDAAAREALGGRGARVGVDGEELPL